MSAPLDLTRAPAHDPLEIYRFRDGLYAVDLIAAAITEFDLFTKLATKPSDLATVCRDLGTHRRPTDVMLTLCAANGFLALKNGAYSVTPPWPGAPRQHVRHFPRPLLRLVEGPSGRERLHRHPEDR